MKIPRRGFRVGVVYDVFRIDSDVAIDGNIVTGVGLKKFLDSNKIDFAVMWVRLDDVELISE